MPRKVSPITQIATAERDRRIIELRRDGLHWRDIADTIGLSMSRCHQVWSSYVKEIPQSVADQWREQEIDILSQGIVDLLPIARDPDVPPRTRAEAWKEIRQHSESRRKITGIDSALKREIEWIDGTSVDAQLRAEIEEMERQMRTTDTIREDSP